MSIQIPKGMKDLLPEEAAFWVHFKRAAQEIFGRYGYMFMETPIIEQTDLFVRGIGQATDVVSKEMFSALSGENLKKLIAGETLKAKSNLSMRPEGTAGIVRAVVQHDMVPQGASPVKLMYAGPMFRAENPQEGRQRQFNQIGAECLGADAPTVDAEAIIMVMRFFDEIGIPASDLRLLVNSMGCDQCRPAYREAVLGYLKTHESELCETCRGRMELNPLRAFDCKNPDCAAIMADAPKITDYLCDECAEHYAQVKSFLNAAGLQFEEDPKLVRGLDYYTRTVFEIQAISRTSAQNAICGGGRYDKLAEEVGGRPTPGLGFALGYERCLLALQEAGFELPPLPPVQLFVVCVEDAAKPTAFELVQACRDAGISADMNHQQRSVKSQFKLADKLGATFVAVLGPDELAAGCANIRNMATHEESQVAIAEIPARLAELLQA